VVGKGTPGSGATFTIAERRSRSLTRSGSAFNRPSVEPTHNTPEPTPQEPTPGPTPGSADTPARTSHLLPGDLDTDSEEDHNLPTEELIQREALRLDERAAVRAAAHPTWETERPPERPTTSRWRAPSILEVFESQTQTRAPSREQREQQLPVHSSQTHQKDPQDPGAPESRLKDQTHHLQTQTNLPALWQTQAWPGGHLPSSPNHLCSAGKEKI